MSKKILAFCGRMNSGKSMFAHYLCSKFSGERMTIAMSLKKMVCKIYPYNFPDIETLNICKDRNTLVDCPINNTTFELLSEYTNIPYDLICNELSDKKEFTQARDILQVIGTDIIRKYNPTWHIEQLVNAINESKSELICVDDVRFLNEMTEIKKLGGECFFVIRPKATRITNHEAETSLHWQDFDTKHIIINDTSDVITLNEIEKLVNDNYWDTCDLLLSQQQYYLYHTHDICTQNTPLVQNILKQNIDRNAFREEGIIIYNAQTEEEKKEFMTLMPTHTNIDTLRHRFVLYNPLIFENLKFFINK